MSFRGDEVTKKAVTKSVTANQHEKPILIHLKKLQSKYYDGKQNNHFSGKAETLLAFQISDICELNSSLPTVNPFCKSILEIIS